MKDLAPDLSDEAFARLIADEAGRDAGAEFDRDDVWRTLLAIGNGEREATVDDIIELVRRDHRARRLVLMDAAALASDRDHDVPLAKVVDGVEDVAFFS